MTRVPCPKCATPVEDGSTACPYCRRPLTAAERAAGDAGGGWKAALPAVALAAAALGGAAALLRWRAEVADKGRSLFVVGSIAAGLAGGGPRAAAPALPPDAVTQSLAERSLSGSCRVPAVRAPVAPLPDARVAYGVVYDMVTGCAVRGAVVTLLVPSGATGIAARTDDDGYYELGFTKNLDSHGDPTVSVAAPGYRPGQAAESDPPWRERSVTERSSAAADLTEEDLGPQPLRYPPSASEIRQDLVLAPTR